VSFRAAARMRMRRWVEALPVRGSSRGWPAAPKKGDKDGHIRFESGLTWDGHSARWRNLKCAVVRFDKKKLGMGIEHDFDRFEEGGFEKFVPLISCNREETIDRAVREFLTPEEGVNEVVSGRIRILPSMLLPMGAQPIIETLKRHIVSGSEREREEDGSLGDYKDKIDNHFLLANAYSALAEIIGEIKGHGGALGANIAMRPHARAGRGMPRNVGAMV